LYTLKRKNMLNERKFTALNEKKYVTKRKKTHPRYIEFIVFLLLLLSTQLTTLAQQQNAIPINNSPEIIKTDTLPKTDTIHATSRGSAIKDTVTAVSDTLPSNVTTVISGTITDEAGAPVGGATIQIKGKGTGTSSDRDGQFSIKATSNDILVVSFVGYNEKEVNVAGRNDVSVSLQASRKELNEVVVVGYGTQKKIDVTGATSSVKSAEIIKQPVLTVTQAIQGKVAGVQIIGGGEPGVAPQVRIRGVGSILNGVNPLYVVDGVITDDITNINNADIASVDILKDASSTAIYGARASNGVVLITTKLGSGKMKVNYSVNLGVRQAADLVKMADAQQYVDYQKAANFSTPITLTGYSTDWYKQVLRNGFYQNHNLSVSGSSDKNRYLLSVGYLTDEGIIIANDYQRITARLNNEYTPNKYLKIGIVASYSNGVGQHIPIAGITEDAYRAAPIIPGTVNGKFGNTSAFQNVGNPILDAYSTDDKSIDNVVEGAAYVEIKPIKSITLRSSFGDDIDFYNDRQYTYMHPNDTTFFVSKGGTQGATRSLLNIKSTTLYHWTWDNTITFNKTFDKHAITVLAGTTSEKYSKNGFSALRYNVPANPNLWYLQNGDPSTQFNGGASSIGGTPDINALGIQVYTRNSYLGRIMYSYNDKYLLTATIRADGSSVFSEQNRWGYFPGVSAGWIVSKESFMQNQHIFDYLKIRGGWGQVGNSNIPTNASASTILANIPYFFNGTVTDSGAFVPQIKNQNLKWEVTSESDLGIEFSTLKERLTGTIDLYDRKVKNALIYVQVPGSFGSQADPNSTIPFNDVLTNAVSFDNKGIELSLRWTDKINNDFSYYIGGNITFNKNEVTSLNGGSPIYDGNVNGYFVTTTTVGHPIGSFFERKVIGVFQNQAEVDNYVDAQGHLLQPTAEPGSLKYQFTNGVLDTVYAGSYQPKAYYGISLGANYKSFDFSVDLYGNYGNKVYNAKKEARVAPTDNIEASVADGRWTPQNHSQTEPSALDGTNLPNSTYFVESGSFIRINNVTIGYTLPARILDRQKIITSVRAFVNGQNLYTIKKYSGFSAELPGASATNAGVDLNVYPTARTYAIGVNIGF
jgi:TonB-linked SusC/RagA family outer membrane protein